MHDLTPAIRTLHDTYCQASQHPIPLTMPDMFRWEKWMARGWTREELCLVIRYIEREIRHRKRWPASLRLYLLIDPERFAYDLVDARAWSLPCRPATVRKDTVVNGTHRYLEQERKEQVAGPIVQDWIKKLRASVDEP